MCGNVRHENRHLKVFQRAFFSSLLRLSLFRLLIKRINHIFYVQYSAPNQYISRVLKCFENETV